jgi:hypothetical protein
LADGNELSAFLQLFADRHQTYVRSRSSSIWRTTSQWHFLSDEELLSSLRTDSSVRRAFGAMDKSKFLVIQVDGTKSSTAFRTTKNLQKQLRQTGLKPKTFYIEELELWQIFVFFAESVSTQSAITLATTWLKSTWFDVDSEAVSFLPSGGPFQIPLQASFTWLNDELFSVAAASEMSFQSAVSMFMQDVRTNAVDYETFENALLEVSATHPIKDDSIGDIVDFTPSDIFVQTVETTGSMDFSPAESPIRLAEKHDEIHLHLDDQITVQTEIATSEVSEFQPLGNCHLSVEIVTGVEFQDCVQTDQLDQTSSDPVPIGEKIATPTEHAYLLLLENNSAGVSQKATDIEVDVFEPPRISAQPNTEPFDESLEDFAEQSDQAFPVHLEELTDSDEPIVQAFLFVQEDAIEHPPPLAINATARKSSLRKSSSRDGPEKSKKTVRTSQNIDPDWDSYEQLTLPFGTNTS